MFQLNIKYDIIQNPSWICFMHIGLLVLMMGIVWGKMGKIGTFCNFIPLGVQCLPVHVL